MYPFRGCAPHGGFLLVLWVLVRGVEQSGCNELWEGRQGCPRIFLYRYGQHHPSARFPSQGGVMIGSNCVYPQRLTRPGYCCLVTYHRSPFVVVVMMG